MAHPLPPSPPRVSLIINADDLGIFPEVNERIFQLMDQGALKSASLLMNSAWVEAAVAKIPDYPHCSFGIHLNITYGLPLTRHPDLQPILDPQGCFSEHFNRQALTLPAVQEAVYREWSAQVAKARALGVSVSHLDSHHHVHRLAPLFPVLTRLQQHHDLKRLRGSWCIFPESGASYPYDHPHAWHATRTTRAFTALQTFLQHFGDSHTLPGPTLWELMTHPGSPHDGDTEVLQRHWWEQLVFPVEILSFNDL
ncbi:MAG: ChbG/HpnK family deacetylase [Magnetococcales bacterium]|nr:ChbG/HpnK family deacetylase [Magnetococcales bacterium]